MFARSSLNSSLNAMPHSSSCHHAIVMILSSQSSEFIPCDANLPSFIPPMLTSWNLAILQFSKIFVHMHFLFLVSVTSCNWLRSFPPKHTQVYHEHFPAPNHNFTILFHNYLQIMSTMSVAPFFQFAVKLFSHPSVATTRNKDLSILTLFPASHELLHVEHYVAQFCASSLLLSFVQSQATLFLLGPSHSCSSSLQSVYTNCVMVQAFAAVIFPFIRIRSFFGQLILCFLCLPKQNSVLPSWPS